MSPRSLLPALNFARTCFVLVVTVGMICFVSPSAIAQDNSSNIGLPPNGVFSGSSVESVQVNNGNLHIEIPLYSVPGRGLEGDRQAER